MLAGVGDPHLACPVVHVGGTNGKGSTAAVCAAVLREAGHRTGLYTSPHLVRFEERFRVDGDPVTEDELVAAAGRLRPEVERAGPTFFEATTALGFLLMARAGVDVAVVEVGLGGRLDSTNVVEPAVAVITNVALDHAEYLGSTLPEIAREKAGIIKDGVPLVTAVEEPGALAVLREVARERGAPLRRVARDELGDVVTGPRGTAFTLETRWGELRPSLPLPGRHQALNAAVAIRGVETLPEPLRPDGDAVVRGAASIRWPGRLQVVRAEEGTWLLDVAHNTAGTRALAGALPELDLPDPVVLLVGILGDKEWRAMLPPLFGGASGAVLTQPPESPPERRWDPAAVLREIRPSLPEGVEVEIEEDFRAAMARARERAGPGTVVVTGSHHTVGGALRAL